MAVSNPFEALRLIREEPGPQGSRSAKKKDRAAQHSSLAGSSSSKPTPASQAAPQPLPPLASYSAADHMPREAGTQSSSVAGPYTLAMAADNLLVALEAGSRRQLACFTVAGPEQAADEGFLEFVHEQVLQQLGASGQGHASYAEHLKHGSSGGGDHDDSDEVCELLALMLGTGGSSSSGGMSTGGGGGGTSSNSFAATAAAASGVGGVGEGQPGVQPVLWCPEQQAAAAAAAAAAAWPEVDQGDWQLAAALQAAEEEAAGGGQPSAARGRGDALQAVWSDWQLAQQWQEEEDAALAAALAAEEERGTQLAGGQAAAARSSAFWSRLRPGGGAQAAAEAGDCAAGTGGSSSSSSSACDPFPSLEAATLQGAAGLGSRGSGSGTGGDSTRQLLLRQHRTVQQASLERGSGVRLLHRGGCQPRLPAAAAGAEPAWSPPLPAACGSSGGLPPLQLEGGLMLHEDDLHYQLLLKDDGVVAAARAAADDYAHRAEASGSAGGGPGGATATSAQAMRSMIDAAARKAGGAAGSGSRPGSAGSEVLALAGSSRPGSAASVEGGAQEVVAAAGDGRAFGGLPAVDPVDTKSFRRLVEDMRGRGWRLMGSAGGGHIRCERTFADLPGFKQVFFLCSTPSDVNYIWNVAAAVKRFDREVAEHRAAAAQQP